MSLTDSANKIRPAFRRAKWEILGFAGSGVAVTATDAARFILIKHGDPLALVYILPTFFCVLAGGLFAFQTCVPSNPTEERPEFIQDLKKAVKEQPPLYVALVALNVLLVASILVEARLENVEKAVCILGTMLPSAELVYLNTRAQRWIPKAEAGKATAPSPV